MERNKLPYDASSILGESGSRTIFPLSIFYGSKTVLHD